MCDSSLKRKCSSVITYLIDTDTHTCFSPAGKEDRRREDGGKDLSVGLTVLFVVLAAAAVGVVFWICKRRPACLNSYQRPADQAAAPQQFEMSDLSAQA